MASDEFVDYYEILQLSPNAEIETIQRVFRMLAQRLHPDNAETGDEDAFSQLLKAYQVLSDPVQRASYDAEHREQKRLTWQIFDQASGTHGRDAEKRKREGILGLLYRKRAYQPDQPSMNLREMEDLLGCPKEHLEFCLWYLKENSLVKPGDNGRFVITVKGVDNYEQSDAAEIEHRLIAAPAETRGNRARR